MRKELPGTPGRPIYSFSFAPSDHKPRFVIRRGVLTAEECEFLVRVGEKNWSKKERRLFVPQAEKESVVSRYAVFPENLGRRERLWDKIAGAMEQKEVNPWNLVLTGIYEPYHLLRYTEGGTYVPHTDYEYGINDRSKLTMILYLRDADTYEGGDLTVVCEDAPRLRQGDAIFFPSLLMHKVSPVTRGCRMVLAGWASGPDFM